MYSLTDQLSLLRWEEHVDVVWIDGGAEILVTVGHSGASGLELPSVDIESRKIRVGRDGRDLPGDVTIIGAWIRSEPMEGATIASSIGRGRLKSKAICDGWSRRLTAEKGADNAPVEIIGGSARGHAKQARDLTGIH